MSDRADTRPAPTTMNIRIIMGNNNTNQTYSPLGSVFSRLVAHLLPVTYFLVTISFYLRTYDSAQIKITITQIGCSFIICLWMAQLVFEKRWPFQKKDLIFVAPFLAFLASGVVSFMQSSFMPGSVDEFIRRVLYSFMGIIVILEFRGWDRHRRLLRWLLAAFGVVVFYGFIQYFDTRLFPKGSEISVDPFLWRHAFGMRPFSTFGNPNFFGNFLVIITPIILAIYLRSQGKLNRPYLLIVLISLVVVLTDKLFIGYFGGVDASSRLWIQIGLLVNISACVFLVWFKSPSASASGMLLFWGAMFLNLYATETKGAWLGFLGSLTGVTLLAGFFLVRRPGKKVSAGLIGVVALTLLIGVGVVGYYASQRMQSVSFRTFTWIATWEMIRKQPLLGTGIGSFKWGYPAYRRPEIILLEAKSNTETDHAEDEYLEVWYDEGLIGFGLFLWLIVSVSVLGVMALIRLTKQETRGPPDNQPIQHVEKVYSLVAYLGAWWGALLHWFVDVSVRFVSSGIYSMLLPGMVVSLVRNDNMPFRQDHVTKTDPWIRACVPVFWFIVLLLLNISPVISFFSGVGLWLLGELLELRLTPESDAAESSPLPRADQTAKLYSFKHFISEICHSPFRLLFSMAFFALFVYGFQIFHGFFKADVMHNKGIFFSRQQVWQKSSEFNDKVKEFSPDIQEDYEKIGGALEHYEKVIELNPFFPMAKYFIGNVKNDWGSRVLASAFQYKQKGDTQKALQEKQRAEKIWKESLSVYSDLKNFAPNYVQVHHQTALVCLKLGDMEMKWGNLAKRDEYWDEALKYFDLYHQLDPVFPPNYYRKAYVHLMRDDFEKAEQEYLGALEYNMDNVVNRRYHNRNMETYTNLGQVILRQINKTHDKPGVLLSNETNEFKKAERYLMAAQVQAEKAYGRQGCADKALKSLASLYNSAGMRPAALEIWKKLRLLKPDDPDVRRVFPQSQKNIQ